jgi:hypothetical protein
MIDTIFCAALAFCLLVGGTLAIASEAFDAEQPRTDTAQQLQSVKVVSSAQVCAMVAGAPAACD